MNQTVQTLLNLRPINRMVNMALAYSQMNRNRYFGPAVFDMPLFAAVRVDAAVVALKFNQYHPFAEVEVVQGEELPVTLVVKVKDLTEEVIALVHIIGTDLLTITLAQVARRLGDKWGITL